MYRNKIVLPDGTELLSGNPKDDAIKSLTFTETVNNGTELMPGCAGVGELSFEIFATNGAQITAGDELTWYKDGVLMGHFWAEKPTRATARTYRVIAYDAMAKTEKDLSPWLKSIQDKFPIPLLDFAKQVCEQCGLELVNTELPNGDYQIQQFYSDGMTARQLLVWVGQACGRFCRATPEGRLEFAWYKEARTPISSGTSVMAKVRLSGDTLRVADRNTAAPPEGPEIYRIAIGAQWYYADGLSYEDYETAVIDKVQINQSDNDVGVIVPPDAAGTNALVLSNNLLLLTEDDASLRPVAETLYEQFKDITYTPFKVTLPADSGFRAGDIVLVTDANGKGFQSYVMSAKISGGRVTLESTGSAARTASTAVNYNVQRNLRGKMLEIQSTVDGLRVTASELSGDFARLELNVNGITATVQEAVEAAGTATEKATKVEQTVDGLTLEASSFVSEDLFAGVAWTKGTTVTSDGSALFGTALYTPADKLEGLNKKTITVSLEYKAESGENNGSNILLWTNYSSGNVSTRIALPTQIKEAKDWTKSTVTVQINDEGPTSFYLWAYTNENYAGSFSVRNATAYIRGNQSSKLTLKSGETVLSSANIVLNGIVTFQNLETAGETIINGSNIKTGIVQNYEGTTIYDLEKGTIQMGSNAGPHVKITNNMIRWYLGTNAYPDNGGPTGIFYSVAANSWIGANSTNTYYGWMPAGTPGTGDNNRNGYVGLRITHTDWNATDVAHFNTMKVECGDNFGDSHGYFESYSAKINGSWIGPVAASLSVVSTKQYGDIALTGTASASPIAFDNGSGVLDETGKCWLFLSDEFASTVSNNVTPQWHITPTSETEAPVTVQKEGLYAVVSGEPGTTFDWLCIMPQKGCETLYCETLDFDLSDGMDRKDYVADNELDGINGFEQSLNDEVLTVVRENDFIEMTWPEQVERSLA